MRLGLHLGLGPNMVGGVRRAVDIGASALQLFCGSPRSWDKAPFDAAVLQGFLREKQAANLKPLAIHATYLLNPASSSPEIWQRTATALGVELARARDMQADFYVIHPGSHRGAGLAAGYANIARCLDAAWKATPDAPPVLFENTAGAGDTIGRTFSELGDLFRVIAAPGRVGVCLDTCHAYAAGYDITTAAGCAVMRAEIDGPLGGIDLIRMLHINDSKFGLGENKDRHEHIGEGFIGQQGFRRFFETFPFAELGGILETPQKEEDDDRRDLRMMERLIDQPPPAHLPPTAAVKSNLTPRSADAKKTPLAKGKKRPQNQGRAGQAKRSSGR